MISDYRKARKFLESFRDYEKTSKFSYQKSFRLKKVDKLFKQLKIAHQDLRVIHIAGTKGKGSTARICAQSLASCRLRVGLYTSPHLFDFRERIKLVASRGSLVSSNMIPRKDLIRISEQFRKKLKAKDLKNFSFFEISTAIAFKYFLDQQVDYAVIETGLGGRLDATNIVKPKVCILTHISYDHTQQLGKKISEIALEKCGIIKAKVPLVCAQQAPAALAVIKRKAKQKKAKLLILGRDFKVSKVRLKNEYSVFNFSYGKTKLEDAKLALLGKHQLENAGLALAAHCLLKDSQPSTNKLKASLLELAPEGRFELVSKKPLTIVDVAHNPSSFSVLADSLNLYYPGKKVILIFGCSKDKDAKAMLKKIDYHRLIVTSSKHPRAAKAKDLAKSLGLKTLASSGVRGALIEARRLYKADCLILVSGSLFLAAQAKRAIKSSSFFRNFS